MLRLTSWPNKRPRYWEGLMFEHWDILNYRQLSTQNINKLNHGSVLTVLIIMECILSITTTYWTTSVSQPHTEPKKKLDTNVELYLEVYLDYHVNKHVKRECLLNTGESNSQAAINPEFEHNSLFTNHDFLNWVLKSNKVLKISENYYTLRTTSF